MSRSVSQVLISIVCSLMMATITYYFFTTSVREADLKLDSMFHDGTYEIRRQNRAVIEQWSIHLANRGKLPLGSVVAMFRGRGLAKDPSVGIMLDPPLPHKIDRTQDKDTINVVLDSPMAPTSHLKVTLTRRHTHENIERFTSAPIGMAASRSVSAWISSDGTATRSVPWRNRQGYTWTVLATSGSRKESFSFTVQVRG